MVHLHRSFGSRTPLLHPLSIDNIYKIVNKLTNVSGKCFGSVGSEKNVWLTKLLNVSTQFNIGLFYKNTVPNKKSETKGIWYTIKE